MTEQYAWKLWRGDNWVLTLSSIEAKQAEDATEIFEMMDEEDISIVSWEVEDGR